MSPSGVEALLFAPFQEFAFLRRALVATFALGLSCGPIGTLLVLRRMSLVGDAMAHALLPGAALGFVGLGASLLAMSLGAFTAALAVAVLAGLAARFTNQREDASFAAFYLIALAAGVMIISSRGTAVDLMHVLFGSVLAVDEDALWLVASISSVSLLVLAVIYRPLLVECFDPSFLRSVGGRGSLYHVAFMMLVVLNLVGGFQALGTLMAVGMMMLPAAAARFWTGEVWRIALCASAMGVLCGYVGLLVSFHADVPTGPAIVLLAGLCFLVSIVLGTRGSLRTRWHARRAHAEHTGGSRS
jgi:zinc/manganese transport system permease protein